MERDGWLERYPCAQDRRRKRIRVTERAETVWSRMVECCSRVSAQAVDGIPDEDLQVFKRTCDRIRENIGVCGDGVSEATCQAELATAVASE
jgi:MarR family transcriptional regulator for hemolysin